MALALFISMQVKENVNVKLVIYDLTKIMFPSSSPPCLTQEVNTKLRRITYHGENKHSLIINGKRTSTP